MGVEVEAEASSSPDHWETPSYSKALKEMCCFVAQLQMANEVANVTVCCIALDSVLPLLLEQELQPLTTEMKTKMKWYLPEMAPLV
jgi:hypothetical protein